MWLIHACVYAVVSCCLRVELHGIEGGHAEGLFSLLL